MIIERHAIVPLAYRPKGPILVSLISVVTAGATPMTVVSPGPMAWRAGHQDGRSGDYVVAGTVIIHRVAA
jgi:hypothetical protein